MNKELRKHKDSNMNLYLLPTEVTKPNILQSKLYTHTDSKQVGAFKLEIINK